MFWESHVGISHRGVKDANTFHTGDSLFVFFRHRHVHMAEVICLKKKKATPRRLGSKQALSTNKHCVPKLSWKLQMLSTNADSGGVTGITELTMTHLLC